MGDFPGRAGFALTDKEFWGHLWDNNRSKYNAYIFSPEWNAKRKQAFAHYGRECARCKSKKQLQVHHKTYDRLFNEHVEDLEVLCKACHRELHGLPRETGIATASGLLTKAERKAMKEVARRLEQSRASKARNAAKSS